MKGGEKSQNVKDGEKKKKEKRIPKWNSGDGRYATPGFWRRRGEMTSEFLGKTKKVEKKCRTSLPKLLGG